MPSYRYLREIDPQGEKPPEPPHYTRVDKIKNWWHYHWKWVAAAALVATVATFTLADVLGRVKPDVTVGIVAPHTFPPELAQQLAAHLSPLAEDINGDGRSVVAVETFTLQTSAGEEGMAEDPYAQMAGVTQLSAAMSSGNVLIFIVEGEDFAAYQAQFQMFGPGGTDTMAWESCPALAALPLAWQDAAGNELNAQEWLRGYRVGLCRYKQATLATEEGTAAYETAEKLYNTITAA